MTQEMLDRALLEVEELLQRQNKSLAPSRLCTIPVPEDISPLEEFFTRLEAAEHDYDPAQLAADLERDVPKLRPAQQAVYAKATEALADPSSREVTH